MFKIFKNLLLLCLLLNPISTIAQERATGGGSVEIMDFFVTERMSRGQLDGCEMTYFIAFEDYIHRQGAVSALRGSVAFYGFIENKDKPPVILLKATAFDFDGTKLNLAPLDYAYVMAAGNSYAGKEYVVGPSDDGGLLVGYDALTNVFLGTQLSEAFSINITRRGSKSDVAIPVNFLIHDVDETMKYTECSLKLLDRLMQKFQQ